MTRVRLSPLGLASTPSLTGKTGRVVERGEHHGVAWCEVLWADDELRSCWIKAEFLEECE